MRHTRVATVTVYVLFLSLPKIENVACLPSSSGHNSGLYVDNGQDQLLDYRSIREHERITLKRAILELLGLPDRPKTITGKVRLMKRSAPNFLLSVYQKSLKNNRKQKSDVIKEVNDFYLTEDDFKAINKSDSIVTFSAVQKHKGAGGKPDRVKRIWFDVDAAPKDERMISAELRLYRGSDAKNRRCRGSFRITVYRVTRSSDRQRTMQFVDTVNTTSGQEGWIILNVTESLDYWINNPADNKGLYLSVNPIDRLSQETRPEDIGIVGFEGNTERQPFMTGFFRNTGRSQLRTYNRSSIGDIEHDSITHRKREVSGVQNSLTHRYNRKAAPYPRRTCALNPFHVNFEDLGWKDWIIAPQEYNANHCDGECKYPLSSHTNATNHAIVQALVNRVHPSTVPNPCCAATKFSTISVLYFYDTANVVLRKLQDMVALECGCR